MEFLCSDGADSLAILQLLNTGGESVIFLNVKEAISFTVYL